MEVYKILYAHPRNSHFSSQRSRARREFLRQIKYAALNLPLSPWNMMELLAFEVVLVSLLFFV